MGEHLAGNGHAIDVQIRRHVGRKTLPGDSREHQAPESGTEMLEPERW
jgi:hypothetical protein